MRIDPIAAGLASSQVLQNNTTKVEDQGFQAVLEKAQKSQDKEKLWDACQQFESVFIYQLMQRMRAAVPKGGLMGDTMGEQVFRGMLDEELSKEMSKAGGIGLAQMVYEQLTRTK